MTEAARNSIGYTLRGIVVSVAFWLCLIASAGCFAAVSLAPKYLTSVALAVQHAENQRRLVLLERQTLQLQEVVTALENDPAFAEELARAEFDAVRPGEEVLPVESELRLDPQKVQQLAGPTVRRFPSYLPLITLVAQDHRLRAELLLAAATLTIVAFTFLHEPVPLKGPTLRASSGPTWGQQLKARYLKN